MPRLTTQQVFKYHATTRGEGSHVLQYYLFCPETNFQAVFHSIAMDAFPGCGGGQRKKSKLGTQAMHTSGHRATTKRISGGTDITVGQMLRGKVRQQVAIQRTRVEDKTVLNIPTYGYLSAYRCNQSGILTLRRGGGEEAECKRLACLTLEDPFASLHSVVTRHYRQQRAKALVSGQFDSQPTWDLFSLHASATISVEQSTVSIGRTKI